MNPALRSALLFATLIAFVVVASFLYSRVVQDSSGEVGPSAAGLAAPATEREAVELNPALAEAAEAVREKRFDEARRTLEGISSEDPSYLYALRSLAAVYGAMDEKEAAVGALTELCARMPDDPARLVDLAWAQHRAGGSDRAEVSVLRALEIDPDNADARYDVAYFRIEQDRLNEAVRAYYRAIKNHPDQIRFRTARERLRQLRELKPDLAAVSYALAFFANTEADSALEAQELERYLELQPDGDAADVARKRLEEVRR